MHQSNHKEEDFFDLLDRSVGVVPKNQNFEAAPPDKTRSNISYTPPKPTLNLGKSLGESRESSVSKAPMSDEEMFHMSMGFASPGVAAVGAVRTGARAASKLLPMVQKGNFEVFTGQKLIKDAKLMPAIENKGGLSRIIEGSKNKIIETVYPVKVGATYGNKHNYQLRSKDYYGSERSQNIAEIKFNMSDHVTASGLPYKLMTDIATFTPKGTNRDYGKLMSILLRRTKHDWAIQESDASLDALYGMTKTWLKRAVDVEFTKGSKQLFFVPSTRFPSSDWIKNNSPFAKTIAAAQKEARLNPTSNPNGESPVLVEAIDDLARKVTTEWMTSGKISGNVEGLFQGKVLRSSNYGAEQVGALESSPFFIKTFKERLAALVGMSSTQFDKYLDKDINEKQK
tara:strand:+ start:144 stop:1337 length:1194 start_codon:yes stop_codon:yes gene_type:complete